MLIDHSKEKLVNSIAFFVTKTRYCGKTKLFKLLYFLDFQHYSITGRNVTGLHYNAWPKGPVPVEIYNGLDEETSDLRKSFSISHRQAKNGYQMMVIEPTFEIKLDNFTKREKKLLEELVSVYRYSNARDMIEETHLENRPWDKIFNKQNARQALIPYSLAIRESENVEVNEAIYKSDEFRKNYK